MPNAPTPIYGLVIPTVSGDTNIWGGELNGDLATLDTIIGLPRTARATLTSASPVIDLSVANDFQITVTAATAFTFANVPSGTFRSSVLLRITNGGAGFAVTFPGS